MSDASFIAQYDQAFASYEAALATLVISYLNLRKDDAAEGISEPHSVVSFVKSLQAHTPKDFLASIVAVAVVQYAAHWPEKGDDA